MVFCAACVVTGVTIGLMGLVALGVAIASVGTAVGGVQITVHIRR